MQCFACAAARLRSRYPAGWGQRKKAAALTGPPASKLTNAEPKSRRCFFLNSIWLSGFCLAADAEG
jgi:hypothetical protein